MFSLYHNPLWNVVGMPGVDPGLKAGDLGRQALEGDAVLLGFFLGAVPEIMGDKGAFDLGAGRQASRHGSGGELFSRLTVRQGGPGDAHGIKASAPGSGRKPEVRIGRKPNQAELEFDAPGLPKRRLRFPAKTPMISKWG